ncbi:hypothetical protein OV079_51305 [Nannocystis pusilla]|uniref:Uncharacterized protein n=1 Tax=Nannocystis pusilla TaxID=889268 RepID=A0A9X3J3Z6_9BACT|nr:hypothetical protein [Nannocystis pusilla]MCY1013780.1 hypothetical protein [Nannocystis pusilla]
MSGASNWMSSSSVAGSSPTAVDSSHDHQHATAPGSMARPRRSKAHRSTSPTRSCSRTSRSATSPPGRRNHVIGSAALTRLPPSMARPIAAIFSSGVSPGMPASPPKNG